MLPRWTVRAVDAFSQNDSRPRLVVIADTIDCEYRRMLPFLSTGFSPEAPALTENLYGVDRSVATGNFVVCHYLL